MDIVETTSGTVRGLQRAGVYQWRGIPYAAPPTRYRPPEPPVPWTGVRDATRFGPVAIQARDARTAMLSGITDKMLASEDCLSLNIVSPAADGARRPVIVWIHGGAFVMGAGSLPLYDGTSFAARHDLVVVTLNYRLGMLGFLYAAGAGNVALLDQVMALRWVRDNIAAFGGDPACVTVMGESAGAVSVSMLLAMPAARGLFHRAIAESGAPGLTQPTRDDAEAIARAVAAEVALDAPHDQLIATQDRLVRERGLTAFWPYVDGDTLPRAPIDAIGDGASAGVPLLVGTNRDEWTLFATFLGPALVEPYKPVLRAWLGARFDDVFARYRGDWVRMIGDIAFRVPALRLAEAQARHAPVFHYRFDFASTAFGGALGAAHALEIPFVWNTLDLPVSALLLGDAIAHARPLADRMHAAWAAFARTGDPGWPRFGAARTTMVFDRESAIADDPDAEMRAAFGV